jgi:hypothetical protein
MTSQPSKPMRRSQFLAHLGHLQAAQCRLLTGQIAQPYLRLLELTLAV